MVPDGVFSRARPFSNRLPSVDQWNATVQRQVTPSITATLAYVGNKGTHTFAGGGPAYGSNDASTANFFPGCGYLASSFTTPDPATCPNGALPHDSRRPFFLLYGWHQNIDYFGNDADNHYNSLQASVEKRFSQGLSFQGSYTFQHSTNYDGSYYNIDRKVAYGPNDDYRNHLIIFTQVYDLPFGKGKKWVSDAGRAEDLLIGGWSINSATTIGSGLPFTPGLSDCGPEIDSGPCRAELVGSVRNGTRSGDPRASGYWFETATTALNAQVCKGAAPITSGPWSQAGCDSFGNVGRNSFRGPKLFNTDFSVFKSFSITEQVKTQFQFSAYNFFNHVNLDRPNGCVDCSGGGSIGGLAFGSTMRRLQFGLKVNF